MNLKEYKEVNGRTLIGSDLSAPKEISKDKEFINEASKDWKDKFLGLMKEDKSFDRKIKVEVLGSHIISHEKYLLNAESVKVSFTQRDGSLAHFKAFVNSSNGGIIQTYDLVGVRPELEKDQFESQSVATEEEIEKLTGMLENDEEPALLKRKTSIKKKLRRGIEGLRKLKRAKRLQKRRGNSGRHSEDKACPFLKIAASIEHNAEAHQLSWGQFQCFWTRDRYHLYGGRLLNSQGGPTWSFLSKAHSQHKTYHHANAH